MQLSHHVASYCARSKARGTEAPPVQSLHKRQLVLFLEEQEKDVVTGVVINT